MKKEEEIMRDHKLYPMYCYHQSLNRQEEKPILQVYGPGVIYPRSNKIGNV